MRNLELGDYKGGRDTLNEAMSMQYAPLQNLAQAANTFGGQGMAGANKLKSQAMEQRFLGDMNEIKFGQEMDKLGTEYGLRSQEQEAKYGFEGQMRASEQESAAARERAIQEAAYFREVQGDERKVAEAERLRLLKEGQDVEAMQGQADYILGLYKQMASGYDPKSKEGQMYNAHVETLSNVFNKGTPYQRAGAMKALLANRGNDPTIASAYLGEILTAGDRAAKKQLMQAQQEVPEEQDAYGLKGMHKDFHWTKPKSTTLTKK